MTVKELKEKLEIIIEDGKEDYTVFVDIYNKEFSLYVNDVEMEVYL